MRRFLAAFRQSQRNLMEGWIGIMTAVFEAKPIDC
jgi:hypothetical protein